MKFRQVEGGAVDFPTFMFPISLGSYFKEYQKAQFNKHDSEPLLREIADYALTQYRLGNEKRAERAYGELMKRDQIFSAVSRAPVGACGVSCRYWKLPSRAGLLLLDPKIFP